VGGGGLGPFRYLILDVIRNFFFPAKLKHLSKLTGEPPVFQGDIILDDKTVQYLAGRYDDSAGERVSEGESETNNEGKVTSHQKWPTRQKKAARRLEDFKWPNATVVYAFDRSYREFML
jgi:hypothetical protein